MFETIALLVSLGGLPVPNFGPLPQHVVTLPVPHFGPLPAPVQPAKPIDPCARRDARGRMIRLPGPVNWFRCPECDRTDDWMYLGDHLRRQHGKTMTAIGRIKYWELGVWHDNLHLLTYKPPPAGSVKAQSACPTCEGGACEVGPVRRMFGRWR